MPTFSGQLGSQKARQGLFQLGATGDAPYTPPQMPTSARPLMVHLYNNDWSFRASLGAVVGKRPILKQTLNSGFQPVTIELPTLNTTIQPGNLVVITEQGGNATGSAPAGYPVIGGIVEQVPDTLDVAGWKHEITITPFVAELGDAFLNKNYSTATDVAQMVRDAVSQTNHLRYTPTSIPTSTGITATYNFSYAPCLEVIDHARLIGGANWSWFVDAIGMVWFQPVNTNVTAMFTVTPKDYSALDSNGGDISGLKNFCLVVGGIPNGGSAPATATYSNPASQAKYGMRAIQPPISVPGVTDQPTLNAIAATVGGVFDRVINRVTVEIPAYSQRIELGRSPTMRYFSPSKYPLNESETGTGAYSSTYAVLDIETDGIQQRVTLGDVPPASLSDVQYQVERIAAKTLGLSPMVQAPFVPGGANILNSAGQIQNATGTTVTDGTGLVSAAVLAPIGSSPLFPANFSTSSTTYVTVTGSPLGFTLARSTRILFVYGLAGSVTGTGGGQGSTTFLFVDGVQQISDEPLGINMSGLLWDNAVTGATNGLGYLITRLSAGNHVVDLRAVSGAGTATLNLAGLFFGGWSLGS